MSTPEDTQPDAAQPDAAQPDSAMASGSDAGAPGEHLGGGDLRPEEERLLAELQRGADTPGAEAADDTDAALRAAEDEAPLPAAGGDQGDGLSATFTAPEA